VPRLPRGSSEGTARALTLRLLGIVNASPDSFSGDGRATDAAIRHGRDLFDAGADMLDIGGESTRPGAFTVAVEEEIARVVPVIRALASLGPVGIDTRNAATMRAALAAGATVINDITALRYDPGAEAVVLGHRCPVILMHMPGTDPATMQSRAHYADVVAEVRAHLLARAAALEAGGLPRDRITLDPGIGFGKTMAHNLALLRALPAFVATGYPILVGASRKRFIGHLDRDLPPDQRVAGSVAVALHAAACGVAWLRVHDVAQTRQALAVWRAIHDAPEWA